MKINIELELSPQEAREMFGMMPTAMQPFYMMFMDNMKQQWESDGKPASEFWTTYTQQGQEAMSKYWQMMNMSGADAKKDS